MRIKISKRAEVTGGFPAADKDKYIPGSDGIEGFSLPVDYWLTGRLLGDIAVGQPVVVYRDTRNGVKADGIFQSSPVVEVTRDSFMTKNSVYDYEYLTEAPEAV